MPAAPVSPAEAPDLARETIRTDSARLQLGGGDCGALVEFTGVVRGEEDGRKIAALEYEAYDEMAIRVMRQICESLAAQQPCDAVVIIHRIGIIPVGDAAIYIGAAAKHRAELDRAFPPPPRKRPLAML